MARTENEEEETKREKGPRRPVMAEVSREKKLDGTIVAVPIVG